MSDTDFFKPTTKTITLPSGKKIVIREQNGDDDEILTLSESVMAGKSLQAFVASITVNDSENKKPTIEDVLKWKINDVYVTALKSRIFSLGPVLDFKVECPDCKTVSNFTENLSEYDHDYSLPFPENAKLSICRPYKNGQSLEVNLTLSSGRVIKYLCRTGDLDTLSLEIPDNTVSKNTEFLLRKVSLRAKENNFLPLTTFGMLSARDMSEIRKSFEENDPAWDFKSTCACGNAKCKRPMALPLLTQSSFFFPVI